MAGSIFTLLEQGGPGRAVRRPGKPFFFGELLYVVAVEHAPKRRAENPFCVKDGEAEGVSIHMAGLGKDL